MTSTAANETPAGNEKKVFRETADYRIRPHGVRVLLTPVSWQENYQQPDSRTLTAPAGMVHDGASIPIVLSFLNGPSIQLAATLHDAAYRFHAWDGVDDAGNVVPHGGEPMTRWEADRIIRVAAKACQVRARRNLKPFKAGLLCFTHWVQRWVIWIGLQPGGIMPWRKSPSKKDQLDHRVLGEIEDILTALRIATAVIPNAELSDTEVATRVRQTLPPTKK